MDYFTSITNMDPYRVGRFDDTRGANSLLFGVGAPGGVLNQSSKTATTHRHSANLRYGIRLVGAATAPKSTSTACS